MLLAEKLLEIDILEGCKDTKGLSEATMATKTILLHITYSHMKVYVDIQMRVMPAFSFSVFKGVSSAKCVTRSSTPQLSRSWGSPKQFGCSPVCLLMTGMLSTATRRHMVLLRSDVPL